jgi:hypothetical protein
VSVVHVSHLPVVFLQSSYSTVCNNFCLLFDIISVWIQVEWLMKNYELAEGCSIPRSTLYQHYLDHCNEKKLSPLNTPSFGKLLSSVFMGLKTRRLGKRQVLLY